MTKQVCASAGLIVLVCALAAQGPASELDTASASAGIADSAAFGPLPPGSISLSAQSGVHAEVSFSHLIPPLLVAGKIPHGLRPVTLRDVADDDAAAAALLARRPDLATHAIGSLTFLAADTTTIDGAPLTGDPPDVMAFWWALAAPADSAQPPDRRARGSHSVELGFWLANSTAAARIRATGWPAEHAAVDLRQSEVESPTWTGQLVLTDQRGEVRATCQRAGPRKLSSSTPPNYATSWAAGPTPTFFTLYTYYGNRVRRCEAAGWTATGEHPLAIALRATPPDYPPPARRANVQDGLSNRGGTYRVP